jgi:hypothetical protein
MQGSLDRLKPAPNSDATSSFGISMGVLFLAFSAFVLSGKQLRDALYRRFTTYVLTNTRALIVTGRAIYSYPLTMDTIIAFEASPPGSIYFAKKFTKGLGGAATIVVPVGFRRVFDAGDVLKLVQSVKAGAA